MPDATESTGRVGTLIVLVVLGIVSARGYLPGHQNPAPPSSPLSNSSELAVAAALLCLSLVVVTIAVMKHVRNRRPAAAGVADRGAWLRGPTPASTPHWRRWLPWLLIGLGVPGASIVTVILLALLIGHLRFDRPNLGPARSNGAPPWGGTTPPAQSPPQTGAGLQGFLYATMAGFLLVLVAGTILAHRTRRQTARSSVISPSDDSEPPSRCGDADSLLRATELGLVEIGDRTRGPRDAIIACYATMEHELAHVPEIAPQDFDTASEVLDRAVGHHALHADGATRLVTLFAEARFSLHPIEGEHRDAAESALRLVLDDLRSRT